MSRSIAAQAEHGAHELVDEAERMLSKAIAGHGSRAPFSFPNTVYYLPIILAASAKAVEKISDLQDAVQQARSLLGAGGTSPRQAPNAALAALLAAETVEALCSADQPFQPSTHTPPASIVFNSPVSDSQARTWGIQLTDGRIPGIALLMGAGKNQAAAISLIQQLRRHNVLCFLSGHAGEQSIIEQVQTAASEFSDRAYIVALGTRASSAVHALGFAARCAMKLGGKRPGMWPEVLKYARRNAPGFVLALGELDDAEYALALAARDLGFTVITDTAAADAPDIVAMPFKSLAGKSDEEKAAALAERCIAACGLEIKSYNVDDSLTYGPAFEDEIVSDAEISVQFGGKKSSAFELLQTASPEDVTDGKVEIIGPDLAQLGLSDHPGLGIVVKVAGKKLKTDYEPLLERQIHAFLSYISGVQHIGRGDSIRLSLSKAAVAGGVTLETLGKVLPARFHEEFAAVEKVQVTLLTEPQAIAKWHAKAREVHEARGRYLDSLTDSQVDEFFVCTNCRAFAPGNVSVITPQRVSPCGQCNWLDAKAGYEMQSTRVRQPIKPGKPIDTEKGIWEGLNQYARTASHGRIQEVALYSVAQSPMSACADFECIVMLVPEANGVMVVSHDDMSATPAGVTVETFASIAAGEQIPGVVGIGSDYLLSSKFIAADGGFKRIVWMSSVLKESMAEELKVVCMREGDPDFMDKVADEHQATGTQELIHWLREHKHPALEMERMY